MKHKGEASRPKVGISHCLLGANVRYNAKTKENRFLIEALSPHVQWIPVCPEAGAGMSVPRPAIELVRVKGGIKALGVADRKLDPSSRLSSYAQSFLSIHVDLSGFVLKARSPSCGVKVDVHSFDGDKLLQEQAMGLFVAELVLVFPTLAIIDEEQWMDTRQRAEFMARVMA